MFLYDRFIFMNRGETSVVIIDFLPQLFVSTHCKELFLGSTTVVFLFLFYSLNIKLKIKTQSFAFSFCLFIWKICIKYTWNIYYFPKESFKHSATEKSYHSLCIACDICLTPSIAAGVMALKGSFSCDLYAVQLNRFWKSLTISQGYQEDSCYWMLTDRRDRNRKLAKTPQKCLLSGSKLCRK